MTVFLLISTQLNCCSFCYHQQYSLGQNTCTALLLIEVYFCIQEYLQQAQDLVENESILLQTLGKEKTDIHVNSRVPCACERSPIPKKMQLSTHQGDFGIYMTVCPTYRPTNSLSIHTTGIAV